MMTSSDGAAAPFGASPTVPVRLPTTLELQKTAHDQIASIAEAQHCSDSRLVHGLSRHTLPRTASFSNLSALHAAVKESNKIVAQYDFVGTSGLNLVFSSKFNYVLPEQPKSAIATSTSSKKRRRNAEDDRCDEVLSTRQKIERAQGGIPKPELAIAQAVMMRMVNAKGPSGEILVQSYACLQKKLRPEDARQSLILAFRINAGIAVSITQLKRALGECWKDGVVSTERTVQGVCDADLPVSEEAAASMEHGNLPMLIVTSVPQAQPGHVDGTE